MDRLGPQGIIRYVGPDPWPGAKQGKLHAKDELEDTEDKGTGDAPAEGNAPGGGVPTQTSQIPRGGAEISLSDQIDDLIQSV
jgi:hypothetical protein